MVAIQKTQQGQREKAGKRLVSHLEISRGFKVVAVVIVLLSLLASFVEGVGLAVFGLSLILITALSLRRKARQAAANATPFDAIEDEPFVLYLRPFRAPGRFLCRARVLGYFDRLLTGEFWDVEMAISYAVRERARTVAIGDPNHSVGALKVITDDATWQDKFRQLSSKAQSIVMIPAPSKSVGWEVGEILGDPARLAKTLFVMPPRPFRITGWIGLAMGRGPGRYWREAQKAFAAHGIKLPKYSAYGEFFVLSADGRAVRRYDPQGFHEDVIEAAVLTRPLGDELPRARRPWWSRFPISLTPLHPAALGSVTSSIGSLFVTLLVFVPFWLLFSTFAYELRSIPSESMGPTLQVGDRVAVAKFAYGYDRNSAPFGLGSLFIRDDPGNPDERVLASAPKRGDIAVFQHPHQPDRVMIKRIIGLPGDTVQMKAGHLFLNGQEVPREKMRVTTYMPDSSSGPAYLRTATEYREQLPGEAKPHLIHEWSDTMDLDETPEFKVPPGHVFMMGDNRDNSEDSRAPSGHRSLATQFPEGWPYRGTGISADPRDDAIGFVPFDHLIGRAETVLFTLYACPKAPGAECPTDRVWRPL